MGLLTGKDSPRYSQYTTDQFTGTGSQTSFALSKPGVTPSSLIVTIDGIKQHSITYTIFGSNIVFSEAPSNGSNIEVLAIGQQGVAYVPPDDSITAAKIVDGTITPDKYDVASSNGTGAMGIPTGTSAQRPSSPSAGWMRMNSTTGSPEWYDSVSGSWIAFYSSPSYTAELLIVAGGGSGGTGTGYGLGSSGGGGAGGVLYYGSETPKTPNGSALTIVPGTTYNVVVGAGGAAINGSTVTGGNIGNPGGNSIFGSYTAIGGGYGSGHQSTSYSGNGGAGGSGGGATSNKGSASGGGNPVGGSGTSGQGTAGGDSNGATASGGGGGAGSAGGIGNASTAGAGGSGLQYAIKGTSSFYAAGGGGGGDSSHLSGGAGGSGIGGAGDVTSNSTNGGAGATNTGSGGGGGRNAPTSGAYTNGYSTSGSGGSGIVVIKYLGSQRASGGVVTTSNGYTIHTFTSSGTFNA